MRKIPQNSDAEWCLLGSYLIDPVAAFEKAPELKPEWFYSEINQEVAKAILALHGSGTQIDYVSVVSELKRRGSAHSGSGGTTVDAYIAGLLNATPTVANAAFYSEKVRESFRRRKIIYACTKAAELAYKEDVDMGELDAEVSVLAAEAISHDFLLENFTGETMVKDFWSRVDERQQRKGGLVGVGTGIYQVDRMLGGLRPGNLIVVAGRPGMGKTALICSIAPRMAARAVVEGSVDDGEVIVFSLEMSREEIADRIICSMARVDLAQLEAGRATPEDYTKLKRASDIIYWSRLNVVDTPDLTVQKMIGIVRAIANKRRVCAVFVDYLQMIPGEQKDDTITKVAKNTVGLKLMARLFKIPVVALAQINRGVERREDKRPELSDLADSGKIEQAADSVLFPFRPAYYEQSDVVKNPTLPEEAEIILAKNRFGPTGIVHINFTPAYTRFDSRIGREV